MADSELTWDRNPVGIATHSFIDSGSGEQLVSPTVVCDDGSCWSLSDDGWKESKWPIPGTRRAAERLDEA